MSFIVLGHFLLTAIAIVGVALLSGVAATGARSSDDPV